VNEQRARYHKLKRLARIPALLKQPALLTDRIQPVRKPVMRMKKTTIGSLI
jgi:hypothetical protein